MYILFVLRYQLTIVEEMEKHQLQNFFQLIVSTCTCMHNNIVQQILYTSHLDGFKMGRPALMPSGHVLCEIITHFIGVMPPQQLLVVTKSQSLLQGTGDPHSYIAVNPLAINALSRLMYWYNSTTTSVMVQSLDGTEIAVSFFLIPTY